MKLTLKISPMLFKNNMFNDDIRKISPSEIPDFDVLCAGFLVKPLVKQDIKRVLKICINLKDKIFFLI